MAYKRDYVKKRESLLKELPDFISTFIYARAINSQQSSLCAYTEHLHHFFCWLHNNHRYFCSKELISLELSDLDHISVDDINRYLANYGENHAEKSVSVKRGCLSSMFNYFYGHKQISSNPAGAAEKVKLHKQPVIYLTDEEQKILLNTIRNGIGLSKKQKETHDKLYLRDCALVLLILDTGLRVSEVEGMQIFDIDFAKCSAIVRRKGNKIETIYFSDEAGVALKEYIQSKPLNMQNGTDYVFTNITGEQLSVRAIENMVKKYASIALPQKSEKISPHKLRSSFAMSFYAASGNDILLLQKRLSHADISTTNIYAKISAEEALKDSRNWKEHLN